MSQVLSYRTATDDNLARPSVSKFEDGREHIPKWTQLFGEDASITQEQFTTRLAALKFDMPIGPPGFLTAKQAIPSQVAALLIILDAP
jgi:hypothetical protein